VLFAMFFVLVLLYWFSFIFLFGPLFVFVCRLDAIFAHFAVLFLFSCIFLGFYLVFVAFGVISACLGIFNRFAWPCCFGFLFMRPDGLWFM